MQAKRPLKRVQAWNCSSSNEVVLNHSVNAIVKSEGSIAKAICIAAPAGSGGSELLRQIASRATRLGKRGFYVDDNLHWGNRSLASRILRSMGVGEVNVEGSSGLTTLCGEIMRLRQYDVLILDDVQKYAQAAKRVAESNAKAILQISRLPIPPLIIMAGSIAAIELYHAYFIDSSVRCEMKSLAAVEFGEAYISFVKSFCEANNMSSQLDLLDIDFLYKISQGRVGLTIRNIEWLYSRALAVGASKGKFDLYYRQMDECELTALFAKMFGAMML